MRLGMLMYLPFFFKKLNCGIRDIGCILFVSGFQASVTIKHC